MLFRLIEAIGVKIYYIGTMFQITDKILQIHFLQKRVLANIRQDWLLILEV
ncbi:hypothetical protein SDC9_62867 [bioreactor metagenome]|uniref:Uncharacterized protein n=1 Tax=bioreactor metagenome TaxID=1076179 RepID=A0A644XJW5_9ZZZZ